MASKTAKEVVYYRHDGLCFYCGVSTWRAPWSRGCLPRRQATMDHVKLKCEDGANHHRNYVLACENCNNERNDQDAVEYFMEKTADQDLAEVYHRILFVQATLREMRRVSESDTLSRDEWMKARREILSNGGTQNWLRVRDEDNE